MARGVRALPHLQPGGAVGKRERRQRKSNLARVGRARPRARGGAPKGWGARAGVRAEGREGKEAAERGEEEAAHREHAEARAAGQAAALRPARLGLAVGVGVGVACANRAGAAVAAGDATVPARARPARRAVRARAPVAALAPLRLQARASAGGARSSRREALARMGQQQQRAPRGCGRRGRCARTTSASYSAPSAAAPRRSGGLWRKFCGDGDSAESGAWPELLPGA